MRNLVMSNIIAKTKLAFLSHSPRLICDIHGLSKSHFSLNFSSIQTCLSIMKSAIEVIPRKQNAKLGANQKQKSGIFCVLESRIISRTRNPAPGIRNPQHGIQDLILYWITLHGARRWHEKKLKRYFPSNVVIGQRYKNANCFVYFKSSYWIIIKKRQKKESSVHGSNVFTVKYQHGFLCFLFFLYLYFILFLALSHMYVFFIPSARSLRFGSRLLKVNIDQK